MEITELNEVPVWYLEMLHTEMGVSYEIGNGMISGVEVQPE